MPVAQREAPLGLRQRVSPAWVFFALVAVYAALEFFTPGGAAWLLVVLVPWGAVLGFGLIRRILRQTIWRLRNRLIVTYVFIAVVPIVLIVALAAVGTWIVVGQVAVYMVNAQLQRRVASLAAPARLISEANAQDRAALIEHLAPAIGAVTTGLEVLVTGKQTLRFPATSTIEGPPAGVTDFSGYAFRNGVYYCAAVASNGGTRGKDARWAGTNQNLRRGRGGRTMAVWNRVRSRHRLVRRRPWRPCGSGRTRSSA